MGEIQELKIILREESSPFFSDEELNYYLNKNNYDINKTAYECLYYHPPPLVISIHKQFYLNKNNYDINKTAYECLLLKAEDDSISLPGGLQLANNSDYWLRLAKRYKTKKRSFIL